MNIICKPRPSRLRPSKVQVRVSFEADGHDAAITVDIARLAAHRGAANPIGQRKAHLLSATPASAGGSHAELAAFEGIDTKQPNTFAVDFDGVAIDYGCRPHNATRCLQNSDDTRWSADKPGQTLAAL